MMGSTGLVYGFGGHGQRRQQREGGGEEPPQLIGPVGSFDRFTFVKINTAKRILERLGIQTSSFFVKI